MPHSLRRTFAAALLMVILQSFAFSAELPAPGNDLSRLTAEQQIVAGKMLEFIRQTEARFWKRAAKLDKQLTADEPQVWDVAENGHYEVRVKRGPAVEKAGVMTVMTTTEQPPFITGGRWNRFIEVAMHPKTPLVGMLHATFSVQVAEDGTGNIGATMDMMQSAQPEEDLELMRNTVTEVFERHGIDSKKYRPHGCGAPNKGFWKWHRAGTCTGVSLYGRQFTADEKTFALVSDLYTTVLDTYFKILKTRMHQDYGEAQVAKQDFMRRRWLEDQLFWDVLAKKFVPYEAWSAVNAPPVVKF